MDTPEILHSAIRQYRHNNSDGLVLGFDSDLTVEIVVQQEKEIQSLKDLLRSEQRLGEVLEKRGDEWKRRAKDLYTGKVVGIVGWFEEKE